MRGCACVSVYGRRAEYYVTREVAVVDIWWELGSRGIAPGASDVPYCVNTHSSPGWAEDSIRPRPCAEQKREDIGGWKSAGTRQPSTAGR
jgi:hypothetical protein